MAFNLKLRDNAGDMPFNEDSQEDAKKLYDAFTNSGRVAGEETPLDWGSLVTTLRDTVSSSNIRPLLSSSIEIMMREPVEPMMMVAGMFSRVAAKGMTTQVLAGALGGAFHAADVGERGTYPKAMFTLGGGMQTAVIGKSGIEASFTEEALRYSTWDLMGINLRMMSQALKRHKERKAIAFLRSLGVPLFDNADPTSSLFGVLSGRGLDMAANGSCVMDDLFKALGHSAEQGYIYDVALVHPMTYMMWEHDPVMRNLFLNGTGGSYFGQKTGNPGPLDPWGWGAMGPARGRLVTPIGAASGADPSGDFNSIAWAANSAPVLPGYGPKGLRIVPCPEVPYDSTTGLSDIYLVSSGNVGFLLEDEGETKAEWFDYERDIINVRLRERYGFALAVEGLGVGVIKNAVTVRNYWDGAVHTEAVSVSEISSTTPVV